MDVILGDVITYIEAPAHSARITLLADVFALLIGLILVKSLRRRDVQVPVVKLNLDLVLLEAGQINLC